MIDGIYGGAELVYWTQNYSVLSLLVENESLTAKYNLSANLCKKKNDNKNYLIMPYSSRIILSFYIVTYKMLFLRQLLLVSVMLRTVKMLHVPDCYWFLLLCK